MNKIILIAAFLVVFAGMNVRAQIVDGVYNTITALGDQAAENHYNAFPGTGGAGDSENAKGQEQRYQEAVEDMDAAALHHVNLQINTEVMKK